LAIEHLYDYLNRYRIRLTTKRFFSNTPADRAKHMESFFSAPEMEGTRQEFCRRYENCFEHQITSVKQADAKLLVVLFPSATEQEFARHYFLDLAGTHGVAFLDLTESLSKYDKEATHLIPGNSHLSRFGNQLAAREVADFILPHLTHRSSVTYATRSWKLGDLDPNQNDIIRWEENCPFHLVTNSQGLRGEQDLAFPKPRTCRVLCLGDSFTFGHGVHNQWCYPHYLGRYLEGAEIINAGKVGYTICDEASYFDERGRFVEPDIVVLQVLSNDLYGFFPYLQNIYCRGGPYCRQSYEG
jgi:hypothetical protein